MQGTKTRLLNNIKHMKDSYEEFSREICPQDLGENGHEIIRKWYLPDRDCFVCKKCGKEIIMFNE